MNEPNLCVEPIKFGMHHDFTTPTLHVERKNECRKNVKQSVGCAENLIGSNSKICEDFSLCLISVALNSGGKSLSRECPGG